MKKLLSIGIISLFILSGITFIGNAEESNIEKSMNIYTNFNQPLMKDQEQFISIEIPDCDQYLIQENKPLLPKTKKTYTFPIGTEILNINIKPKQISEKILDAKIVPSPKQVLLSNSPESVNPSLTEMLYDDNPYPNTWGEYYIGTGIINGQRSIIVTIDLFPVQYYPNENIIRTASSIDVDISYNGLDPETQSFETEFDLIVITPAEYLTQLQPLISHKESMDVQMKIVTLDDIYTSVYFPSEGRDNQERIKYFIKNAIENWNIMAVMLVGGNGKLPARTTHIQVSSSDKEVFVSDLYYADIYNDTHGFASWDTNTNDNFAEYNWNGETDEVDGFPDVYIGRLAAVSSTEVQTAVNKIISYENMKAYTQNWFTNIIGVGGDTFPEHNGDDSGVSEGELVNDYIFNIMDGFVPNRLWASNGVLSGVSPTGIVAIENAFKEGAGFVDFSGHGNTYVYATHPLNGTIWLPTPTGGLLNNQIATFNNQDKLPIVITGACSVAKYNKDSDCFSWSFVSSPNGGAIASCGATALGYGYIGSYVTQGLIEGISINMFRAFDKGALSIGEMWAESITDYIHSRMNGGDYKTIEEWHLFGDPTLALGEASSEPATPSAPEGPTSGSINTEYTYTTTTTDPEGDKIYYLFDWGDESFSGWVGPYNSGQKAMASNIWKEKGNYEIRVKAKDNHGVQSEWSDPIPISMPHVKDQSFPRLFEFIEQFFPNIYTFFQLFQ
jgi:peptidase C25-like protein